MEEFKIFTHDRSRTIGILDKEGSWVCELSKDNHYYEHSEINQHAKLICEAFNVANETGLTPSQLHAELEKAKELIAGCVEELDAAGGSENEWTTRMSKRLTTFLTDGKK